MAIYPDTKLHIIINNRRLYIDGCHVIIVSSEKCHDSIFQQKCKLYVVLNHKTHYILTWNVWMECSRIDWWPNERRAIIKSAHVSTIFPFLNKILKTVYERAVYTTTLETICTFNTDITFHKVNNCNDVALFNCRRR